MKNVMLCVAPLVLSLLLLGCDRNAQPDSKSSPESASGISKASVQIKAGADGFSTEQRNVRDRLLDDNKVGAIKHLYVISPYSGQVILYSTVRGKVTSSGKRLDPYSVSAGQNYAGGQYITNQWYNHGPSVSISGQSYRTSEVLQDDGTYGSSCEYIFWWDQSGKYHQHFFTGGQIIHVSDYPINVRSVTINMEQVGSTPTQAEAGQ